MNYFPQDIAIERCLFLHLPHSNISKIHFVDSLFHVMRRNRFCQFIISVITIIIAIASRKYSILLPPLIGNYAPDVLWALTVFWLLGLLFPNKSTSWIAVFALLFSYCIELSQLHHSPFIDVVRATVIGGLILGYTFIWSDLFCYTLAVLGGVAIEKILYRQKWRQVLLLCNH